MSQPPALPDPNETPVVESHPERRAEGRSPCRPGVILRLLVRPWLRRLSAYVADSSRGGVGLILDERLDPGTVLALEVRDRPRGLTYIRSAQVAHCTLRPDGLWRAGCRLSLPLTPGELDFLRGEA